MLSKVIRLVCTRLVPVLVMGVAIFVGWLSQAEIFEGRFFATVIPLGMGVPPPSIIGHGKMKGTPPVPDDMMPLPRPEKELFLRLPETPSGRAEMVSALPTITTATGDAESTTEAVTTEITNYANYMPASGIGMCCRASAYDDVLVERTVLWYLLSGGRHIDGAHIYLNHRAIGAGIRQAMARGIAREEIFVTTKLWPSHYGYNLTKETVPTFLEELGLEYIDLILMHAPVSLLIRTMKRSPGCKGLPSTTKCRQDTFQALSELRAQGIVRNVGVSNFAVRHLKEIAPEAYPGDVSNTIAPIAMNQIVFNPWVTSAWMETYEYCKEHGIGITGYNSLGGAFQVAQASTVETLTKIASKYQKTVAQVMLRWTLQMGAAVIPGTGNPHHMKENLEVYSFELSMEDIEAITNLRSDESAKKFFFMDPTD